MLFSRILLLILLSLTGPSAIYIYLYPIIHNCGFPIQNGTFDAPSTRFSQHLPGNQAPAEPIAPFRLLALGDPQLEGDSSLPRLWDGYFPTLRRLPEKLRSAHHGKERLQVLGEGLKNMILRDVFTIVKRWRKQLDLLGNDYYLAHIYRCLHRHLQPTHVTVLGDLLGSQWVNDDEFERRGARFWRRVFRSGQRVEDEIMAEASEEILGKGTAWNKRIMNVAGNHDIGYAGDITVERVERFERVFGKVNWEIVFRLPPNETTEDDTQASAPDPKLRIVVLNNMILDTPARTPSIQTDTYDFLNNVIQGSSPVEDRTTGTIVLTHIPLFKEAGICTDGPFFDYYESQDGGGVKEQYHLSPDASKTVLEGIFGMSPDMSAPFGGSGRNGIIIDGHDHEGCDVYHHVSSTGSDEPRKWNVSRWQDSETLFKAPIPGIREVTVRSMMGDFGGNAGLLSAWFDYGAGEWRFAYSTCSVGAQQIWWAVHVMLLLTICLGIWVASIAVLDQSFTWNGAGDEMKRNERQRNKDPTGSKIVAPRSKKTQT